MIRLLIRLAALAGGASWLLGKLRGRAERIQIDGPGELDLVTSPVAISGTGRATQHNALGSSTSALKTLGTRFPTPKPKARSDQKGASAAATLRFQ